MSLSIVGCEGLYSGLKMNGVYTPYTEDCGDIDTNNHAAYYSEDLNNFLYLSNEIVSQWEGRGGIGQEY